MFGDGTADPRLGSSRFGVVPRVCEEVVTAVEARRSLGIDASLKVAYVEVYGAQVSAVRVACRVGGCACVRGVVC